MTRALALSALYRALRTAIQTYAGTILTFWLSGGQGRLTGLWEIILAKSDFAGGAALLAALGALGWRAVLDPSPVPSLSDPAPDQATP